MSSLQNRIDQFRRMASEDPDNELGHFRLGQLFAENGDYTDAIASFERTLELQPSFSKVYQLLGGVLMKLDGRRADAVDTLTRGWHVADERGDRIPRTEMEKLLKELGAPIPESVKAVEEPAGPGQGFPCKRPNCTFGKTARQNAAPPVPDAIGLRIYGEICFGCWNDWLKNHSVKVINETRIDLSTEYGQTEYDRYMLEFLGFEDGPTISENPENGMRLN